MKLTQRNLSSLITWESPAQCKDFLAFCKVRLYVLEQLRAVPEQESGLQRQRQGSLYNLNITVIDERWKSRLSHLLHALALSAAELIALLKLGATEGAAVISTFINSFGRTWSD